MKEQLAALYNLQSLDIEIDRAKAGLAALDGAKALQMKYKAAKAAGDAAQKALTDLEIELKDSELKLKSIDEKRKNSEKRLYGGSISSPKEISSVEKEIEHLKNQQGQLDERVLELYDLVEAARGKSASAKKVVDEFQKRVGDQLARESAERKKLEAELAELEPIRAHSATKITDKHLFSRYEGIRKKNGSTGIAKVIDGKCEGCHVTVTSFTIRNLFDAKDIEYCENCGRILTLDAE